jgi:uncharacterized protein
VVVVGTVRTVAELAALYDEPQESSLLKEVDHLTDLHARYVEASPFVLIATNGPEGLDCSPRGDAPGFVRVADGGRTLLLPDRRGNNRLDSLRNIVVDGRVGLLFLVPGIGVALRVNGTAELSTDDALRESFTVRGAVPRTVIVVRTTGVYTQCPKALVRSHLWDPARFRAPAELPTVGQIMAAVTAGRHGGPEYDRAYPERLARTLY